MKISELENIELVQSKELPPEGDELGKGYLELRHTSKNLEEQLSNLQLIQSTLTGQLGLVTAALKVEPGDANRVKELKGQIEQFKSAEEKYKAEIEELKVTNTKEAESRKQQLQQQATFEALHSETRQREINELAAKEEQLSSLKNDLESEKKRANELAASLTIQCNENAELSNTLNKQSDAMTELTTAIAQQNQVIEELKAFMH